jgi:tRNA threonylcarbamoyladenosine biosynthesis protein TsaE
MATFISHSPAETEALGAEWGRQAAAGWVIGLAGDLGAGKTQLVKGIARGLGSPARVHSPTFALLNEYPGGRLPLFHLDLYRLATAREIREAGLEEYLARPPGVVVVEWYDRWGWREPAGGPPRRLARLRTLDETTREIAYEDFGA